MILHLLYSFIFTMAAISCLCDVCVSQETAEQFSCYQGTVQSNRNGQLPLGSELRLSPLPCGPPISSPTTQPTTKAPTAQPAVKNSTTHPTTQVATAAPIAPHAPTQPPTTSSPATTASPASTSQPSSAGKKRTRRDVPGYMCTVVRYFTGTKLTPDSTWTANFTCMPAGDCPNNKTAVEIRFCCSDANCNSLSYFRKMSGAKDAVVSSCLTGSKNSTASQVIAKSCAGLSHYCVNRTLDKTTTFGCSIDHAETLCRNRTKGGTHACTKDGNATLCCCDSDNCNGPPRNTSVQPTRMAPPETTPYLVPAKPTSNWFLVLIIAAGVLVGGLVGAGAMILCRRWKKKRATSGPLNISYSRVSADCANEDDDNIFSY